LGYQSLEGSYASCAPDPERISWRVELHNIALTVTVIFARLLSNELSISAILLVERAYHHPRSGQTCKQNGNSPDAAKEVE
ncbi:MAG: hypothetical protein ACLQVY_23465, partial [Limisphaerales bacterium]